MSPEDTKNQTQPGGAPLDLKGLKELYGEDTVAELLQMSVDEARGLIEQLQAAIGSKDTKPVMAAAHQLKGLSLTMTLNDMADLSLHLEGEARTGDWDAVAKDYTQLQQAFERLEGFVKSLNLPPFQSQ